MKMSKIELESFRTGIAKGLASLRTVGVRKSAGEGIEVIANPRICFTKYLRGGLYRDWTDAPEEQRIFKALGESVGTAGGFLVPPEISTELIEFLKPIPVVRNMPGVRVLQMKSNKMEIGRVNQTATVTWGGENANIAEDTSMAFGLVTLQLKKAVCLYKCSRELLRDASPSVDALVKQELAEQLGLAEDLAFLEGTGGTQPLGIYYHPYVLNTLISGPATFDTFADAAYQVECQHKAVNGWISHPRLKNSLRKLKDANGNYLFADGKTLAGGASEVPNILGQVAAFTTQVAIANRPSTNDSYAIGADWSQVYVGEREGIRIETTDVGGESFQMDQIFVKAVREVDIALRHPQTLVVAKGIQV
jgi:HK97 family phage major capsid protein